MSNICYYFTKLFNFYKYFTLFIIIYLINNAIKIQSVLQSNECFFYRNLLPI